MFEAGLDHGVPAMGNLRPGDEVSVRLISLVRMLRERGIGAGSGSVLRAHTAIEMVDPTSRWECQAALRSVLCSRREHLPVFEAAFGACFGDGLFDQPPPSNPGSSFSAEEGTQAVQVDGSPDRSGDDPPAADPDEPPVQTAVWSAAELLRHKDFAEYSVSDEQAALAEVRRLASVVPQRSSRRLQTCRRNGDRLQMRATMRAAMRHGGEVTTLSWQQRSSVPRPLVLVCDVSASMSPYARMFMHYLHAAVQQGRQIEAFVFGTRLTRVTTHLASAHHATALAHISQSATDWGAGTRIGESIGHLNRRWGNRVGRGAVVIVLSDGWDCGDPDLLAAEMARLRRCSHNLIWLNPLRARPGYEPLTRGMRAALPQTDIFESGNSLEALHRLNVIMEAR